MIRSQNQVKGGRAMSSIFDILGRDAAIGRILGFIQSAEPTPTWSGWYIGITNDPNRRLYEEHSASVSGSIVVAVESEAVARSVEKFFIEIYGMAGNPGGGDAPRFVYAFKMGPDTNPPLR